MKAIFSGGPTLDGRLVLDQANIRSEFPFG